MKVLFLVLLGLETSALTQQASRSSIALDSEDLSSKVVMVSWGTRDCNLRGACQLSESMGTGIYCTYRGKTGVLTNYHVLPSAEDATPKKYGKVHFQYTGKQLTIPEMQREGIDMKPEVFYYNGGEEASGHDWAFVAVDEAKVHREFPTITPYNLEKSRHAARAQRGDTVVVFHHRGGEPRLAWRTTIMEDDGEQGTLDHSDMCTLDRRGEGKCGGDPLEHGSSGSPIWLGDTNIGVFWGELTQTTTTTTAAPVETRYNRFATIQSVLEQLDSQLDGGKHDHHESDED